MDWEFLYFIMIYFLGILPISICLAEIGKDIEKIREILEKSYEM